MSDSLDGVRSLLEAPSPAVLTTYRNDGTALVSPVWFRWSTGGSRSSSPNDVKLRHLARDPRCALVKNGWHARSREMNLAVFGVTDEDARAGCSAKPSRRMKRCARGLSQTPWRAVDSAFPA